MFFFDLLDHCAHQLLPLCTLWLHWFGLEPQRFLKLRKTPNLTIRGDVIARDATDRLAIGVIGHQQFMLTLCPHFIELYGNAHVLGILRLRVADVVGVVGGAEVGLVHAFEDGHRGSLERVVMYIFKGLRTRVEDGLGLELRQEHRFLKWPFAVLPLLGSSWLHLFFNLLYASSHINHP